jgi:hypothetical protein
MYTLIKISFTYSGVGYNTEIWYEEDALTLLKKVQ